MKKFNIHGGDHSRGGSGSIEMELGSTGFYYPPQYNITTHSPGAEIRLHWREDQLQKLHECIGLMLQYSKMKQAEAHIDTQKT